MTEEEARDAFIERQIDLLGEMFEAGVIIVTYREGKETLFKKETFGNEFAVDKLIECAHDGSLDNDAAAEEIMEGIKEAIEENGEEDDDDGEEWKKEKV